MLPLAVREIDPGRPGDLDLLRFVYADLFVSAFPDPDERESLENIVEYLRLKAQGWYGENSYHVLVAEQDGQVVGAVVADYLAVVDAGVVEFLVVDPHRRRGGIGTRLLRAAEEALTADATKRGRALDVVVAEIDDPFVGESAAMDPVERSLVWDHWGYRRLTFPYVQPALTPESQPVTCLLLTARTVSGRFASSLPAAYVTTLVGEYIRWAMRIDDPPANPDFRRMAAELAQRQIVALQRLSVYVGELRMEITEIHRATDPLLDELLDVYDATFIDPTTAVGRGEFRKALALPQGGPVRYHLWAVRRRRGAPIEGLVSFFVLSGTAFGGYMCLTGSMARTGLLRPLVERVEQRMLSDQPDLTGWYVECADDPERSIFRHIGFHELDVPYVQPSSAGVPQRRLHLLRRTIGGLAEPPRIAIADLVADVATICEGVYGLNRRASQILAGRIQDALDGASFVPLVV